MKTTLRFALAAAAIGLAPITAQAETDCLALAVTVKNAAAAQPADVLVLVEKQVAANPGCACEVVKAAIQGAEADTKTVAAIVETASTVVPDKMRMISQCAVAVSPDSLADVQGVLARLDPNRGESGYSAKSAKGGVEEPLKAAWNPLDFPGQGPVGPTPGGPPIIPPGLPPTVPPVVNPPVSTDINRPFSFFDDDVYTKGA